MVIMVFPMVVMAMVMFFIDATGSPQGTNEQRCHAASGHERDGT
jgi:hypothetical protein